MALFHSGYMQERLLTHDMCSKVLWGPRSGVKCRQKKELPSSIQDDLFIMTLDIIVLFSFTTHAKPYIVRKAHNPLEEHLM